MIVPKIPAGAVGTLCETTSHKSSKSRDGSRKMLRVQGRGVERFKVEVRQGVEEGVGCECESSFCNV